MQSGLTLQEESASFCCRARRPSPSKLGEWVESPLPVPFRFVFVFFSFSALLVLDVPGHVAAFYFPALRSFCSFVSLSQVSVQPIPPFRYPFGIWHLFVTVQNRVFEMLSLGRGVATPPESIGSFRFARRPVGYTCPQAPCLPLPVDFF